MFQTFSLRKLVHTCACAALIGVVAFAPAYAQQFQQPSVVLTTAAPDSGAIWPTHFLAGDLDGDGRPDLVYFFNPVQNSSVNSNVLFNNGGGTFTAPLANGGPGYLTDYVLGTVIAPMNHSGKQQLVTVLGNNNGVTSTATVIVEDYTGQRDGSSTNVLSTFQLTSSVGATFTYVAALDVNGDGINDLLVEDTANSILYVLLNDGTGKFVLKTTLALSTADGVGPILTGDFNHDGHTDFLIITIKSRKAIPYYGSGDGNFTPFPSYMLQGGIFSALIADINGDGMADLVVEGSNGSLSIFPGTAAGFLTTPVAISGAQNGPLGLGGRLVAIADLDGNGLPDIITASPVGISVLLAQYPPNSHLPFVPNYTLGGIYNAGPGRSSYALADFNGDGHLDLAVDSPEGVAILYGNADGSFQTSRAFAAGQPAYSLALGQFTGSGYLDVVVATGVPQLQLLTGSGNGLFTSTGSPSPANAPETDGQRFLWSNITVGDFDGDGKLDAAITLEGRYPPNGSSAPPPDGLTVQFGNGDGTFSAPVMQAPLAGSPHYGFSAIGDFNGDGVADIANLDLGYYATYNGGSAALSGNMQRNVLYNDTYVDSSNGQNPQLVEPDSYDLIATGYLNPGHTGKQDIVMEDDSAFVVYQNNGDGTFFPGPTAIADNVATFTAPSNFHVQDAVTGLLPSSGVFPGALLLKDIDGDGYGDVLILYHNLASDPAHPSPATPNQLYIYWGQGNRNFNPTPTILTLDRNFYQAAVADMDGDGIPDLVLSDGYVIGILHGLGNHTFGNELHILAGQGINMMALADVDGKGATDIVVANGGLTLSNPVVTNGTLALNTDVFTGGITVLPNTIVPHIVTGSVVASPEPSIYGADFTLTATVTPPASGVAATGNVTFSIDGNTVGTGTLSGGTATYAVVAPTILRGTHTLAAAYSGDGNYTAATFTGSHSVTGLRSESFYSNSTPTIYYGQVADGVGSVEALDTAPNATLNGGSLTFYDGSTSICVLPVNGTAQTCPASAGAGFQVGNHVITVMYSGNDYYEPSTSAPSTTVVIPDDTQGVASTTLTPSTFGQPVTLSATFSALYATPVGPVTFYDGTTPIFTTNLNSAAVASMTTSTLAVGTHNISATLSATLDFNASTTPVIQQVVVAAAATTTTTLISSVNPSLVGQNVTFTANVSTGNAGTPTGTVNFMDGSVVIGSGTFTTFSANSGSTSFSTSTLTLGTHPITAVFVSSGPATGSMSVVLEQQVISAGTPGFTLTVNPTDVSVGIGSAISVSVTVTETGGYSQPVMLACSGLPAEATCGFGSVTIPAGGGTTLMALSPAAPHDCGSTTPYFVTPNGGATLGAFALGVIVFFGRRRKLVKGLVLAAFLCILPVLSGCGHCTDLGVRPGTYGFNVSGTSTGSPSTTQTVSLKMNAHL